MERHEENLLVLIGLKTDQDPFLCLGPANSVRRFPRVSPSIPLAHAGG